MSVWTTTLRAVFRSERGATAAEYCILASMIAGVIVGVVFTLGQDVLGLFQTVHFP